MPNFANVIRHSDICSARKRGVRIVIPRGWGGALECNVPFGNPLTSSRKLQLQGAAQ